MTVHDDLATLRSYIDTEGLGVVPIKYAREALSRVEAEIARLTEDRDTRMISQFRLQDERDLATKRAEAAEAEVARLQQLADDRLALMRAREKGYEAEVARLDRCLTLETERAIAAEGREFRLRDGLGALANPDGIVRGGDPAGVRIPSHEYARALLADQDGAA